MHYARMTGHDYHEGYYFVTINTAPRRSCLSRIAGGKVELLLFEEERAAEVSHYLELAQGGATLIGGFISPGEKEVAKGVLEIAGAKVVCLLPYGLKGYKPHGVAVKRLAESKTLVLSGFPESVPSTPINYGNCHLNNDWARLIALGRSSDESPDSQP